MRPYFLALSVATAVFTAGAADAADLEIRDAVVRVTVVPEDRADMSVEVIRSNPRLPLVVRTSGDGALIDGGLRHRIGNCHGEGPNARASVRGVGKVGWSEMPQVVVHTPRAVEIRAGGAVQGVVGRSAGLELHNSGCGAWTIADVAGAASIDDSGVGSVRMGAADRLDVQVSGAAHVHAVRARQGLDARLSGAGAIQVGEVNGPLAARVSGVGSVRVAGGQAGAVHASVSGIGAVTFGGVAESLDASVSGLGKVRVNEVTGPVSKSVSGGGHIEAGVRGAPLPPERT